MIDITRDQMETYKEVPELTSNILRFGEVKGSGYYSDIKSVDFDRRIKLSHSLDLVKKRLEQQHPSLTNLFASSANLFESKKNEILNMEGMKPLSGVNFGLDNINMKLTKSLPSLQCKDEQLSFKIKQLSTKSNLVAKVPRFDYNTTMYRESLECLQTEAEILSKLSHEHIITIHGVSTFELGAAFSEHTHFIILEELSTTLDKSLREFTLKERTSPNSTLLERMDILFDLACALKYLHSEQVIHRDIKPANVGFNNNGVLKVFDFGLATCLKDKEPLVDGLYRLEECHGTYRYMAPEVFHGSLYNETADVYSFGVLIWEVLSLRKPFKGHSKESWQRAVRIGERPVINKSWPAPIKSLLQNCWATKIRKRPKFEVIVEILREQTCVW